MHDRSKTAQKAPVGRGSGEARAPVVLRLLAVAGLGLVVANCSQQKFSSSSGRSIDPKYGVAASPRVVAEGEAVPKGGGRELVGKPYVVAGQTYVPRDNPNYQREGLASWYGTAFHGRLTANGEVFDRHSIAAAHPTMPLPSYARVTNLTNSRSMIVRVNDRGPYHANRIMDVSERVAEALNFRRTGTARIRVEYVGKASTRGSDDEKLYATLRDDGRPAVFPGAARTMFAEASPAASQQALAFRTSRPPVEPEEREFELPVAAAPVAVAALPASYGAPAGRAVSGIPLPPERPFDLGTIPNAATPVRATVSPMAQLPPSRAAYAGLFFAAPELPRAGFTKDDPFRHMKPQRFVALRAQP